MEELKKTIQTVLNKKATWPSDDQAKDRIELTPDEKIQALAAFRKRKAAFVGISPNEVTISPKQADEIIDKAEQQKYADKVAHDYWKKVNAPRYYPRYTHQQWYEIALNKAKQLIPGYVVDGYNKSVISKLSHYFSNSMECEEVGINPKKGIMLTGVTGCGKTSLMRLFTANQHQSYYMMSCRDVGYDFMDKGFEIIKRYSTIQRGVENIFGQNEYGYCFDDLGTDDERRYYGNNVNAMTEIILNRYDSCPFRFTHVTTNLNAGQIEEMYGARVRSRMREMFNLIAFNTDSPDRRT